MSVSTDSEPWDDNTGSEYFGIPSCDFLVPPTCGGTIIKTTKATSISGFLGCDYQETNEFFRVMCSRHHSVGPGTKCEMFCIDDPLEIEHEVRLQIDLYYAGFASFLL